MPQLSPASATPRAPRFASPGAWAVAISLFAHAALVGASGLIELRRGAAGSVVPLHVTLFELSPERPRPRLRASEAPPPGEAPPPVEPSPPAIEGPRGAEAIDAPATRAEPRPERVAPAPRTAEAPKPADEDEAEAAREEAQRERARLEARRARLQIIDLELATALALGRAKRELAREDRLRTFSLDDLDPAAPAQAPRPRLGVFDSPSAGRAGIEHRNALGQAVRWVSDECFTTSGASNLFGFPAGADIYNLPITSCVKTQPRDDLFEHLRED